MGQVGRPPKPTKLKIITGNPGKRPLPKGEPQPTEGAPTRPEWLSPEAKREWTRLVAEFNSIGLLTKVDRMTLTALCQNWADYVDAVADLREHGWSTVTESGYEAPRPAVAKMHKALDKVLTIGAKYGITPSDRARMAIPEKPPADPFADFLNRKDGASSG